jgi:hypothetical protein
MKFADAFTGEQKIRFLKSFDSVVSLSMVGVSPSMALIGPENETKILCVESPERSVSIKKVLT